MLNFSRDEKTFEHNYVVEEKQTVVDHLQTKVENTETEVENKQTEVTDSAFFKPQFGEIPTEPRDFSKLEMHEYDAPVAEAPPSVRLTPRQIDEEPQQIVLSEPAEFGKLKPAEPAYRVIGTLFKTYILIELDDALIMIDQHAAHERILYEKFTKRLESGGTASQPLLVPVVIDVAQREMALLQDFDESLRAAGYEVEPFGERSISVRAVPFILGRADVRPAFMEMLESLDRMVAATKEARRDELAMMACKAAVKGGDSLTASEINSLIDLMRETGASPTCPHGRPVSRTLTRREIEKMFRRIQ